MPSADDYAKRVKHIIGAEGDIKRMTRSWKWNTIPEAKQHLAAIRQMQKELRQVKRDLNVEMKAIRTRYKMRMDRAQAGVLASLAGRGAARRSQANKRRRLCEERDRTLAPYDSVKLAIDDALTQLDRIKLELQGWVARQTR